MADDLAGLGKIADSKLVNKVYDDALGPAAKQVGLLAEDLAKTARLFALPLQLGAAFQDRLVRWLDTARSRVPPERQIDAAPEIVGPAIRGMQFIADDNPLIHLYLQLLAKAIDREAVGRLHPAFSTVLEQLSADEAIVLYYMRENSMLGVYSELLPFDGSFKWNHCYETTFPLEALCKPEQTNLYFEHLSSLNVIKAMRDDDGGSLGTTSTTTPGPQGTNWKYKFYCATYFGRALIEACIPPVLPFDLPN